MVHKSRLRRPKAARMRDVQDVPFTVHTEISLTAEHEHYQLRNFHTKHLDFLPLLFCAQEKGQLTMFGLDVMRNSLHPSNEASAVIQLPTECL